MATRRRNQPPATEAAVYAAKAIDKTTSLKIKFINSFKGRGVFATVNFQKGDFVVEYRGELIHYEESQRRRRIYHHKAAVFMFDFYWNDKQWCIDASLEDGSFGRLVNDEHINPNCKMKKITVNAKPHLCLFALRDINPGEEITYNYGGTDWPWRQVVKPLPESSDAVESEETDHPPTKSAVSKKKVDKPLTEPTEAAESDETDHFPSKSTLSKKKIKMLKLWKAKTERLCQM
ncbi:N-lysine methyltransferase SETD8-A [Austrofundulus limnaeus]|uniref:N-lysine methyltransferase SETD8-A n=1 Tax=Austrofundulus limnaeus TaxID=52670 RepID=A0A2I4DB28_AUSLI|nr:PREDICTED: N-lysine methyltransferase SETD8-A-like [Austrofundulus limnaeus]